MERNGSFYDSPLSQNVPSTPLISRRMNYRSPGAAVVPDIYEVDRSAMSSPSFSGTAFQEMRVLPSHLQLGVNGLVRNTEISLHLELEGLSRRMDTNLETGANVSSRSRETRHELGAIISCRPRETRHELEANISSRPRESTHELESNKSGRVEETRCKFVHGENMSLLSADSCRPYHSSEALCLDQVVPDPPLSATSLCSETQFTITSVNSIKSVHRLPVLQKRLQENAYTLMSSSPKTNPRRNTEINLFTEDDIFV